MSDQNSAAAATLDMQFVNSSGLPDDQVLITFQDPSFTLQASFQDSQGNTVAITRHKSSDVMTKSYTLAEIGSAGINMANAQGPVVFVSFASTANNGGFVMDGDLSGDKEPSYIGTGGANYYKAYQPFEITYVSNSTHGQGNLTNINYLAAPLSIQSYNAGAAGQLLQTRGYYNGTATGSSTLNTALKSLTGSVASAKAELNGNLLRYIGPSSYGVGANPYPPFNDYLDHLHSTSQVTKIQNQNAFNTMADPAAGNINYDYALDFTATVAVDRTITVSGDITTSISPFGQPSTAGKTYTGAELVISPTSSTSSTDIFNNTIYGQADPLGAGKGSTSFNSVWTTLETDMAALGLVLNSANNVVTYSTTQSLAIGEITTGLLGGFPGSSLLYTGGAGAFSQYNNQAYKDVPSKAWWNSATIPSPSTLQANAPFYSGYSEIIFDATENEVYSIPFSDRFGQGPLLQSQLYDNTLVDTWVVTVGKPLFML